MFCEWRFSSYCYCLWFLWFPRCCVSCLSLWHTAQDKTFIFVPCVSSVANIELIYCLALTSSAAKHCSNSPHSFIFKSSGDPNILKETIYVRLQFGEMCIKWWTRKYFYLIYWHSHTNNFWIRIYWGVGTT